ncbi:MAG: VWA domain-containing protein [Chitinispirillaceae bacterium]|nr:VWA domain-containing protein [Chitinispirillaceae bacterium]
MPVIKLLLIISLGFLSAGSQTYNLTVTAGPHGTTLPSGTVSAKQGLRGNGADAGNIIAAYPDSGYIFDRWEIINGEPVVEQIPCTQVILYSGDASVKAHFTERGKLYEITPDGQQYNFATHYTSKQNGNLSGILFRFTTPAAGVYRVVVEEMDAIFHYRLHYFGKDPTLTVFGGGSSNIEEGTLSCFVSAVTAGEEHYFSVSADTAYLHSADDFTIWYEPAAVLTLERKGGYSGTVFTTPIVDVPHTVLRGKAVTVNVSNNYYISISPFSHWEVVSGDVTITDPASTTSSVIINSDSAVVRAVLTTAPADTLIVQTDGHGNINRYDTIFSPPGKETLVFTAIPDDSYRFASWSVIEGNVTLNYPYPAEGRTMAKALVTGGKATIRANFSYTGTELKPEVTITDVDISGHPDICVSVSVTDSAGRGVTGLDSSSFTLHEDGNAPPFSCTSVAEAGGMSVCLVIDKSKYMARDKDLSETIMAAKTFIASMTPNDRCAVVAYDHTGHLVQEMTGDTVALNRAVDGLVQTGMNNPNSGVNLGVSQLLHEMEPRIILMYASGFLYNTSDGWQTVDSAVNNNVIIYHVEVGYYSFDNKILSNGAGGYILDGISPEKLAKLNQEVRNSFGSRYILSYRTSDTIFNGDTHTVIVSVNYNNRTARDTAYWDESNQPPVIILTDATQALLDTRQPADTSLTITADITDDGTLADVRIYYRTTGGNGVYTEIPMSLTSGTTYHVVLPADVVHSPGVDFYIVATDEFDLSGKSPKVFSPRTDPWVIFVGRDENQPPMITLTPSTWALINTQQPENSPLTITAVVNDDGAVANVKLFYRTSDGTGEYSKTAMTLQSGNIYEGVIPQDVVLSPGVDFYLLAMDDQEISTKSPNIPENGPWVIIVKKGQFSAIPAIREAFCLADNGDGSVTRIEILYYDTLYSTKIPDSIRVCWPDSSDWRMIRKNDYTVDPSDSAHLTITLPVPFPEGITRYTGWNGSLGLAYGKDPSSPDERTVKSPFALADSVGPLIANALLIERLKAGNDTLVLDFTEPVDYSIVKDQCLTLLKGNGNGEFTEVPLMVIAAFPHANGRSIITVVPFTTESSSPKEGDSLRITPSGPIVDGFGNRAHPLNRPAVLSIKKIPPDIVKAVYEDRDADGMVDRVRIIFNKPVLLDSMEMGIVWNGATGSATPAQYTRIGTGAGGDTVDVNVAVPLFPVSVLKDRTSGPMHLMVRFKDYETANTRQAIVEEGAAPVLVAMRYYFGEYLDDTRSAPDTVYAKFSEPLGHLPMAGRPFLFQNAGGQRYIVSVRNPAIVSLDTAGNGKRENYYRFIVTEVTADPAPAAGDSSWIDATISDNIVDGNNNVQGNGRNKRVALFIRRPPLHLNIRVGPNPFSPINDDGVTIRITTKTKVAMTTEYKVCATFYDKVGNVIKRFPEDMRNTPMFQSYFNRVNGKVIKDGSTWYLITTDSSGIWWDGTTRNSRIVGDGTYLVIPRIFYTIAGLSAEEYPPKSILIGVKRAK